MFDTKSFFFFPPLRVKFPLSHKSAGLTELGKSVLLFKGVFMLLALGFPLDLLGGGTGTVRAPCYAMVALHCLLSVGKVRPGLGIPLDAECLASEGPSMKTHKITNDA